MARKQTYKTTKGLCDRCGEESRLREKVSARIFPPKGGRLCLGCVIPSALEAQQNE